MDGEMHDTVLSDEADKRRITLLLVICGLVPMAAGLGIYFGWVWTRHPIFWFLGGALIVLATPLVLGGLVYTARIYLRRKHLVLRTGTVAMVLAANFPAALLLAFLAPSQMPRLVVSLENASGVTIEDVQLDIAGDSARKEMILDREKVKLELSPVSEVDSFQVTVHAENGISRRTIVPQYVTNGLSECQAELKINGNLEIESN